MGEKASLNIRDAVQRRVGASNLLLNVANLIQLCFFIAVVKLWKEFLYEFKVLDLPEWRTCCGIVRARAI